MYPPHGPHPPGHPHPFDPGQCQWDFMHDQQRRQQEAFTYLAWRDAQERRAREVEVVTGRANAAALAEAAAAARARARRRRALMLCAVTDQQAMEVGSQGDSPPVEPPLP